MLTSLKITNTVWDHVWEQIVDQIVNQVHAHAQISHYAWEQVWGRIGRGGAISWRRPLSEALEESQ